MVFVRKRIITTRLIIDGCCDQHATEVFAHRYFDSDGGFPVAENVVNTETYTTTQATGCSRETPRDASSTRVQWLNAADVGDITDEIQCCWGDNGFHAVVEVSRYTTL